MEEGRRIVLHNRDLYHEALVEIFDIYGFQSFFQTYFVKSVTTATLVMPMPSIKK